MIRENQKYLNKCQVFLDLFFVAFSFVLAHYIRFYILSGGNLALSQEELIKSLAALIPVYFIIYHIFDLYSARRTKPLHIEISAILKTNILATILLMMGLFIFKLVNFSRLALILFFIINLFLTVGSRLCIRLILKKYRRLGYNQRHCLLLGTTESSTHFINKVRKNPQWGYSLIGILETQVSNQTHFLDVPILGTLQNIEEILENKSLDMVIIGLAGDNLQELGQVLDICEKSGIKTQIIPYYHQYIPAKPYMDDLDGLPVIDIRHVPLDNIFKSLTKRSFDIAFAFIAILLTSPILLFAALMTKFTSPGPIIFKQERVGLNRKNFYMYKFRSMRVQTDSEEKDKWTTKNDPRKTKWGTFMRKTSIDELPQFFNVLKGDMSIVGPRPERPFFVDQFKESIPRYMIKHQVRPGITGWAQVNGFRGDTSIEGRIQHDLYYIENWTFGFDLRIILLTIFKGFINKNAY
ncbi:MAG: undecaprenyl-phosphate glucose phosphotransferase [Cellulosilyticaceae bacterium]